MVAERKIFGTDGVRGVANCYPMTSEVALALGRAAGRIFRQGPHRHAIVIGKDTRLSGYMLETALASGICSMGVDVMLVGPLPTPGVAFITRGMRADAGVMISASHNPHADNGIKFFDRDGFKLPDSVELEMEAFVNAPESNNDRPTADAIGKAVRIDDADGRYITFLKSTVPAGLTFDGIKVAVDCAHGAGYRVAPAVFAELGAHVMATGISPDGRNINRGCGSLHPEHLTHVVRERNADCGISLDGDADRIIMCDAEGNTVDGDAILAMCAIELKRQGNLRGDTVVATTMSNLGLDLCLREHGIHVVRTDVGDRYVMQEMREKGYNLGGEQSGHVIFADHNTTGDGVLAGLQVLTIMQQAGKTLADLSHIITPLPQVLSSVRVRERRPLADITSVAKLIATFETELGNSGRILVRYSGTEPVARIMVEGSNPDRIRTICDDLSTEITKHIGTT